MGLDHITTDKLLAELKLRMERQSERIAFLEQERAQQLLALGQLEECTARLDDAERKLSQWGDIVCAAWWVIDELEHFGQGEDFDRMVDDLKQAIRYAAANHIELPEGCE